MHRSTVITCFAASVRKLRSGLEITQEELAERADLHRTYIAGIERGVRNPTLLTIKKLARGVGSFDGRFIVGSQMQSLLERNAVMKKLCLLLLLSLAASARAEDPPSPAPTQINKP